MKKFYTFILYLGFIAGGIKGIIYCVKEYKIVSKEKSYEGSYKDGKKHGEYISYYSNGDIESEGTYKNGFLHGECRDYYENGNIKVQAKFSDEHEYIFYRENGDITDEAPYWFFCSFSIY